MEGITQGVPETLPRCGRAQAEHDTCSELAAHGCLRPVYGERARRRSAQAREQKFTAITASRRAVNTSRRAERKAVGTIVSSAHHSISKFGTNSFKVEQRDGRRTQRPCHARPIIRAHAFPDLPTAKQVQINQTKTVTVPSKPLLARTLR